MKGQNYLLIIILVVVYFFMNIFVFFSFSSLFSIQRDLLFYVLFTLSFLSFIILTFLETYFPNPLSRLLYVISVSWAGFLLFFMCLLVIYQFFNIFFDIPKIIVGIAILCIGSTVALFSILNAALIHVRKFNLPLSKLNSKIKIVQLSDLHLGTVHNIRFLNRVVNKTISLNPDLVVITGDLIDGTAPIKPKMLSILNKIQVPVLMVFGNHELYDLNKVYKALSLTRVKVLRDNFFSFKGLQILGLDFKKKSTVKKFHPHIKKLPKKLAPRVILTHVPISQKSAQDLEADLVLSGHLHGGQIFPVNLIAKSYYPHYKGMRKKGESHVYISQGTGTWGPPMRLFSRNEITEINLIPKKI